MGETKNIIHTLRENTFGLIVNVVTKLKWKKGSVQTFIWLLAPYNFAAFIWQFFTIMAVVFAF